MQRRDSAAFEGCPETGFLHLTSTLAPPAQIEEAMTDRRVNTASLDIKTEVIDQRSDMCLAPDMDDIIEEIESAVIDRIHGAMTAWSEQNQPEGVEAGRQDYATYFCGGDWKVYVEEDRYFDYGHTEYDFTVNIASADVTSIDAIAAPVIAQLKKCADEMLGLLDEVGEDVHEIDDLSLEAPIALILRVLDASPLTDYDDGTWSVTPMPAGGVRLGVRVRIDTSERLERELRAGQRLREAK